MKEYLKMGDEFTSEVRCEDGMLVTDDTYYADIHSDGDLICHAINSHDELVAEVERLRARVSELEEFTYHFCDNSYNVDLGGGDCTATTCEAKDMAHKLDNRVWPDLWPGH